MERYITFFTIVSDFPSINETILDGSDFEDIDSAFTAISRYKYDPDFPAPNLNSISDFVLDTQNQILYCMLPNGRYKDALANSEYIRKLIIEIQNKE